jgi:hypothetical protein
MTAPTPPTSPRPGLPDPSASWRFRLRHPALTGAVYAVVAAAGIGVPTGVVPTAWFIRMTAVTWWAYPVWAGAAVLIGVTAARRDRSHTRPQPSGQLLGGVGTALAVGCPACNQVVTLAFGPAGTGLWASIQPAVGVAAVTGLLCAALRRRRNAPTMTRPVNDTDAEALLAAATRGATCLVLPTLHASDAGSGPEPHPGSLPVRSDMPAPAPAAH